MKPFTKEFKAFKAKLNNITITKGKISVNESDLHNPPIDEPQYIDIEGYVLNGEYNAAVVYNALENDFVNVRNEFKENLRLPEMDGFDQYIHDIFETYTSYENKIVEEDGNYSTDFIKFENCSPDDINAHFVCNYSHFLESLKQQLREEIIYLHEYAKMRPSSGPNNILKIETNTKNPLNHKSFELVYRGLLDKDCIKEFALTLSEYNYILESERNKIKRIFSGIHIEEPVVWTGEKGSLKYLIKQLRSKGIIKKNKAFWHTTSNCFKFNNEEIKPENISTQNLPTKKSSLEQLDKLINILHDGNQEIRLKRERKI